MPSQAEITTFIEQHEVLAYLLIIAWTFLEGETIVIIAGMAAQHSPPNPFLVMAAAFAGSLLGDQTWFFIGRLKGKAIIAKRPFWQTKADKVYRIFERHHTLLILGFRFLYGLRNITPFVLGMSEVRTKRFIMLNVIGAAVWAAAFTWGGYAFGMLIEKWFMEAKVPVLIGLIAVIFLVWLVRMLIRRSKIKKLQTAPKTEHDAPNQP